MISQLLKKKLFTKFDANFFSWTRLPIFFFRFHRKKQAHGTLDPWITCRKASLTFYPKHLRARLSDSGSMQVTELQAVMTAKTADATLVVQQSCHTRMRSLRHGRQAAVSPKLDCCTEPTLKASGLTVGSLVVYVKRQCCS
jgi:hypothetical protein